MELSSHKKYIASLQGGQGRSHKAKIQDASDYIHTERFEVELDIPEKDFYVFALTEGFAQGCFGFLCRIMQDDERMKQWINEAEAERKNKCSNG